MVERFNSEGRVPRAPDTEILGARGARPSEILLLPGSRADELRRHLPVMLGALKLIREKLPSARAKMVLPDEALKQLASKQAVRAPVGYGNPNRQSAAGARRGRCRHRLDRHGDDGVRVLRRADGDALQNLVAHLPDRQTHREGEMADDAEYSGGRGNLSRIRPKRRHAGKYCRRRAGAFAKRTAPRFKSKSGWRKLFRPWAARRATARRHGDFEFVQGRAVLPHRPNLARQQLCPTQIEETTTF
jgi:hypothetical protein